MLLATALPAQAQLAPTNPGCLDSAVLQLTTLDSPEPKLVLSLKVQKDGKPLSPKVEQGSGQWDVDKLALQRIEACNFGAREAVTDTRIALSYDAGVFSPEKVQAAYEKVRSNLANQREYHVFLIETASEEAAQAALAQLANSEFEQVARKVSQAKSARYGGNLGWQLASSMGAPMAAILRQGKWPALYPAPVQANGRWFVLSVAAERAAEIPSQEDASEWLRRALLSQRAPVAKP